MKNKWMLVTFGIIAVLLMAAAIPTASSFLGNREKGIGIEVTTGGDIKILPKTTVGKTYVSNPMVFSGNMSFTNSTLTLDSSLVFQNAATITNPDSIFVNESAGIVLNGGVRVKGGIKGRSIDLNGALVVAGQTTIATTITGLVKAASGVLSGATANVDYLSVAKYDSLVTYLGDGLLQDATILITAAPEKFKTTTTAYYTIGGIQYSDAAADNLTFSAAYTINTAAAAGTYYGIFLIQIDAAGTVSTKAPAADQVYTSSALALAALPAADTGNIRLGYIIVNSKEATDWVANTDDMTDGSDCITTTFTDYALKALPHVCP